MEKILSRITNDVDTLQTGINQSVTQLITSATTLIGVLVMMLSINVWMTLAALFDFTGFDVYYQQGHETFPEILPGPAEISW